MIARLRVRARGRDLADLETGEVVGSCLVQCRPAATWAALLVEAADAWGRVVRARPPDDVIGIDHGDSVEPCCDRAAFVEWLRQAERGGSCS
ncbi:hypothetical protein [Streptomyces sp. NPDC005017]|uniref:hypothetical protein n=1 Tax=Streptomyces sp. NPDC005017 TaxID=3364706 RepID=UPI0036BBE304